MQCKSNMKVGISMRGFFSLDGSFNKYGTIVVDTIILSLMWLFFSLPIITIGAATTAMFYVSTRRIANREGYITSDFWSAFKSNFKQATCVWLLILAVVFLLVFNIENIHAVGAMATVVLPAQIAFIVMIALMSVYIFPLIARFEMNFQQLIKSAFFMAIRHLLTTFSCVLLFGAMIMAVFMFPLMIFLGPGAYAMLSSLMLIRVFKIYRPEMDKDPVLEIQEIEAKKAEERRQSQIAAYGSRSEDSAEPADEEPKTFTVFKDGRIIEVEAQPEGESELFNRRYEMKKYVCLVCSYVYDEEAEGGVKFDSLPDDYACPLCSVGKDQFEEEK